MLTEKACLVHLSISRFSGTTSDKTATQDIADAHSTSADWVNGRKRLIEKTALKPINRLLNEARSYHYRVTLPWNDGGQRLLPTDHYLDYVEQIGKFQTALDDEVRALDSAWHCLILEAKHALNGLFKREEYPDSISGTYGIHTTVTPIPDAADLRIGLDDADLAKVKNAITSDVNANLQNAMNDVWDRLKTAITHCKKTLESTDTKRIYDSVLGNVQDLADMIPALNVTNDLGLDALAQDLQRDLKHITTEQVKADPTIRSLVVDKTSDALDSLNAFMGV